MRLVSGGNEEFNQVLRRRLQWSESIQADVEEIIKDVRRRGDAALVEYTMKFDGVKLSPGDFWARQEEIEKAYLAIEPEFITAMRRAQENIVDFHRRAMAGSWFDALSNGRMVGQLVVPVARAGVYVPGGTAAYPSTVLMTVIPAKVAGVEEITLATPPDSSGQVNPYVLVAAAECGVTRILKIGGAQAIAALAYGTESIGRVDVIAGPGNIYVTKAKKLVYGDVRIDLLAGPSEICVLADDSANPDYVAADLLSQAEHDESSWCFLVTPSPVLAEQVQAALEQRLRSLPRQEIAYRALDKNGIIVLVTTLVEAFEVANEIAPEHLELCIEDPLSYLGKVRSAGAVFLGHYTPEALGDYVAGPSHVLPTGGSARFESPLSAETFMKRISVISFSTEAFASWADPVTLLAEREGLRAHAESVRVRLKDAGMEAGTRRGTTSEEES